MSLTMVRNRTDGPATFSDPKERIELSWAGLGDPNGGDVQRVPDSVMENPDFQKAFDRGVFEVVDTDAHKESLVRQADAANAKEAEDAAAIESMIDRTAEQSLVTATIDESGKLVSEDVTGREPVVVDDSGAAGAYTPETDSSGIPTTVPADDGVSLGPDGKPVEGEISVVMGPRERG